MKIKIKKIEIARGILNKLPEWFGLPDSVDEYVECSNDMPFWEEIEEECTRDFIALKETSKFTAEIYVMGVLKEFECFPTLWDEWNPCQVYVMAIAM